MFRFQCPTKGSVMLYGMQSITINDDTIVVTFVIINVPLR